MRQLTTVIFASLFVLISSAAPMMVNAADTPHVQVVYTINTHNNTQAYLEVIKPIIARLNKISPKTMVRVYEAQFAGSEAGKVYVVVEQPSMTYMDEIRDKVDNDAEITRLFPKLIEISTREATGLYVDRAPQQATGVNNRVQVVYAINTNGHTAEYLAGTKKVDARFLALSPKATVRVFESMFDGEGAGTILIIVGYPSMTYLEENNDKIGNDAELTKLFADRDKIGASIVSVSLLNDITP